MRGRLTTLAIVASTVAIVFVAASLSSPDPIREGSALPYVSLYDHPANKLESNLNQGDGQAFAALAQDPLLQRPEVFRQGAAEAAYRAQRPLFGWLGWALSGGQAGLVPMALLVLSVVGFVSLAMAVGAELLHRGGSPMWALVAVLSPGALVTLDWSGPDAMAAAAAVGAVGCWMRGRQGDAIVLLVAAALLRETTLIVPVALSVHALALGEARVRDVIGLAIPFVVFVGWVGVVWVRLGALPTDAGQGRLGTPFAGLADAAGAWSTTDYVAASVLLGFGLGGLVLARRDPATWVAAAFGLVSTLLGSEVWRRAEDFGRVLLPMVAFGAVAVGAAVRRGGDHRRLEPITEPRGTAPGGSSSS